ncbi:MAG TPA: hypothetical protein VNY51_01805 [Candidatus Dormibacteraeota bacterium]|jgi:hypothetical protein|nr:hypothetical protein [Candidatus Dormibacteraeota bacterium]
MYIIGCYVSYLLISLALTVWVARTLHKNGRVFLVDAFRGNFELADSVIHLSVVSLCLVNIGCVLPPLRMYPNRDTLWATVELVSEKIGLVLLVLGITLFFNLFLFSRVRKRSRPDSSRGVVLANPAPRA